MRDLDPEVCQLHLVQIQTNNIDHQTPNATCAQPTPVPRSVRSRLEAINSNWPPIRESSPGWQLAPPTRSEVVSELATPTAHPLGGRNSLGNSHRPPPQEANFRWQLGPPIPYQAVWRLATRIAHPLAAEFSVGNSHRPPFRGRFLVGNSRRPPPNPGSRPWIDVAVLSRRAVHVANSGSWNRASAHVEILLCRNPPQGRRPAVLRVEVSKPPTG